MQSRYNFWIYERLPSLREERTNYLLTPVKGCFAEDPFMAKISSKVTLDLVSSGHAEVILAARVSVVLSNPDHNEGPAVQISRTVWYIINLTKYLERFCGMLHFLKENI